MVKLKHSAPYRPQEQAVLNSLFALSRRQMELWGSGLRLHGASMGEQLARCTQSDSTFR